ncbi:Uridine-cytidine kinase 2 [Cichlidogyrus casuarinus]|uniref:uridine/cytidine kinase n=1 Tax=Cichlidogyrus casuarinus TaxID=1844966 RepID=A0ABD2QA51_9PLAT
MSIQKNKPIIVGISGGACSGKTEACRLIEDHFNKILPKEKIAILPLKLFYKSLNPEERLKAKKGELNMDHPNAFDFELLVETIKKIKNNVPVTLHQYSKTLYESLPETIHIGSNMAVILVVGILAFYQPNVRDLLDLKIFVTLDDDSRLATKINSEVNANKRSLDSILLNYFRFVKPAFEEFCQPSKKYADIILPNPVDNHAGMHLIADHLTNLVQGGNSNSQLPLRMRSRNHSECTSVYRPH